MLITATSATDCVPDRATSALLIVDVQEAFRSYVAQFDAFVASTRLLVDGAQLLGVPIAYTEQYPKGLGATVPELRGALAPQPDLDKLDLSAATPELWAQLPAAVRDAHHIVVVGLEAHVCVRHTALDLVRAGRVVHVPIDAVASHTPLHRDTSLAQLARAGCWTTSVEQVLFDWLGAAGTPEFRGVQALLKSHAARASSPSSHSI